MATETSPEADRQAELVGSQWHTNARGQWWKRGLVAIGVIGVATVSVAAIMRASSSSSEFGNMQTHAIKRGELLVTVTEQGTLESSNNTEVKCKVRGDNTIIWVVESGTEVEAGDELVRLDTLFIEEQISERTKYAHLAKSAEARSKADLERAKLAISEYLQGRFVTDLAKLQKDLAIAESKLLTANNILGYKKMMSESNYVSELDVEAKTFEASQADLTVKLTRTQIDVLKRFTKREELATLNGAFVAAKAGYEADRERAYADEQRLERAQDELGQCIVRAERSGMVIYPTGNQWEDVPDIEEGSTVHKDQVLLLMPDLSKMQVKVGIHESIIGRIKPGMIAIVTLPNKRLEGCVSSVASIAQPAGWWTGNVVKYDTIIELSSTLGLKPGMSVVVEVIMARHENVLMIPASAVSETSSGYACWVETLDGTQRRTLELGDSSDMFIVVESGLQEGDTVIINPLAYLEEAQLEAAKILDDNRRSLDESEF
jgi:multidrug efflux pump subunit AcrA (membrane-fusion protein)